MSATPTNVDRRDFFNAIAKGTLVTSGTVAAVGAGAMIAHTGSEAIERAATAGNPKSYPVGSLTYIEDARVWLGRDNLGFYAIDAHCTHLGCLVQRQETGFSCPCHGSSFNERGHVTTGPATKPLRYLLVELDNDGNLSINRTQTVSEEERLIA